MSDCLEFAGGERASFNATKNDAPSSWARSDDGIGVGLAYDAYYSGGRKNFFAVIWQVNLPKEDQETRPVWSQRVRLQVEAPTQAMDGELNDLKWEVIQAILDSNVRQTVLNAGFGYDTKGLRTKENSVRKNKTSTVFYVVLKDNHSSIDPKEQIRMVHDSVGWKIDEVVKQFNKRLERRFGK